MRNSSIEIAPDGSFVISGKTIMSGYVADEQHTANVLKDGKIYSDDMGYFDDLGLIHITGRRDDIINVGGYKVDPVEVENTVVSLPEIRDCICIADKHPILGTSLKLLYVVEENKVVDKKEIALHIKSCLESYKVPQSYEQVEAIRLTYNGKKDRKSYR
jgi:acyl-CoA synthetase (AMP-forming)/AMP-acid ligase II